MAVEDQLKVECQIKKIELNQSEQTLLSIIEAFDALENNTFTILLSDGIEKTLDLSEFTNMNFVAAIAQYQDADAQSNIAKFDPAVAEFDINTTGTWFGEKSFVRRGTDGAYTSFKVRRPAGETRTLRIKVVVGAAGA